MAEFLVKSSDLYTKAGEIRELNAKLKKAVEEMTQTEQSLMTMWDGDAKEAFDRSYKSDKVQLDYFSEVIEKYCEALEVNAATYDKAESDNVQTATTRTYK